MKIFVSGATPTMEQLLAEPACREYLGAFITPNTRNDLARICSWQTDIGVDNGCFDKERFSPDRFKALCRKLTKSPVRPKFVAVPDVVHLTPEGPRGDHKATLERFWRWLPRLIHLRLPLAFVAQDGLDYYGIQDEVPWDFIEAVFIGGGDEFKDDMTMHIAQACRERGKWCHLGRVNGRRRLRLARMCEVDSVDGSSLSRFAGTWLRTFCGHCSDLDWEAMRMDLACLKMRAQVTY